jgi:septum formation protein
MNELKKKFEDYRIILGSQSPRREQLLKTLDIPFEVVLKDVDESFPENFRREDIAMFVARKKAMSFMSEVSDGKTLVITADSIVCVDELILGKPKDAQDAHRMLKLLSGRKHIVITGVCIMTNKKSFSFFSKTDVSFRTLKDTEIDYYIEKFSPLDKAGSYGIQEWLGMIAVEYIFGSYNNVMGLPVKELYDHLLKF